MYIEITDALKHFARRNPATGKSERITVLDHVSLTVDKGEFICLLGPSGCGKTTLMNVVAGFESLTSGSVTIDGVPVTGPSDRYVMIFQQYGLLPWRNVIGNVELGLESRNISAAERRRIAEKYLRLVHLEALAHQHPHELSGGQKQRVAIARALAVQPEILFMDEPFGALDAITRYQLQNDLRKIIEEEHCTIIFVTHDMEEAIYLADRVVVMEPNPGRIRKIIPVHIPEPRIRNGEDFAVLRKKIFREYFSASEPPIEYFI